MDLFQITLLNKLQLACHIDNLLQKQKIILWKDDLVSTLPRLREKLMHFQKFWGFFFYFCAILFKKSFTSLIHILEQHACRSVLMELNI